MIDRVMLAIEIDGELHMGEELWKDEELMWKLYFVEGLYIGEIADLLGCNLSTVREWLFRHGIETKTDAHRSRRLERGSSLYHMIRRNLSREPWPLISQRIREEADGCELCGEYGGMRSLAAHHIVPVLAGGVNEEELLMPLCHSCHQKVERYTERFCPKVITEIVEEEAKKQTEDVLEGGSVQTEDSLNEDADESETMDEEEIEKLQDIVERNQTVGANEYTMPTGDEDSED